jgi:NADPH:quinone reductase-like Zn-dependent oxidoreductase
LEVGPQCTNFKPGDDVFYVSSTTRQGTTAEYVLVDERHCAKKPKSLDFVEAASIGLTFGTAYQSLVDRLEIKSNENVGILIVSFPLFPYLMVQRPLPPSLHSEHTFDCL